MFGLIGAGAAAALLLWFSIGQPVWFDEGYSILLAKQSWGELLSLTAVDAHPPFYYLLLKAWGDLFGFTEFALRSLSALLMGGAVFVGFAVLRRLFSTKVALYALPFMVFAPFLLRYGYEVRMYALATLIAVSATYALIRAVAAKGWKWWIVYGGLVALGMYTLYLLAAVWLAHFVWVLVSSIRSKERPFWRWKWLYAYAGAVVLFAAYIPIFVHQLLNSALPGMGNAMTVPQLTNIASMFVLYAPEWTLGSWGTIGVLLVTVALTVLGVRVYKKGTKQTKKALWLLLALSFVPIVFYGLASLSAKPIYIVRYMAHSGIFIYMLIGVVIALGIHHKVKRAFLTAAFVIMMLLVGVVSLWKAGNFNLERMQQPETHAVRTAAECDVPGTQVIADDPYTFIDSAFYFQGCSFYFFSKDDVAYKGGYAMLHGSTQRVALADDVTAERVVHLHWDGNTPGLILGDRYEVESSQAFDKQVVTIYKKVSTSSVE